MKFNLKQKYSDEGKRERLAQLLAVMSAKVSRQ